MSGRPTFRACDRCYRLKERCLRVDDNQGCCGSCIRRGHTCTILRNIRPRGRPSRTRLDRSSNEHVWFNHGLYPPLAPKAIRWHECLSSNFSPSAPSAALSLSLQPTPVQDPPFSTVSFLHPHSVASKSVGLVIPKTASPPPPPSSLLESNLSGQCYPLDDALLESMRSMDHFLSYFMLGPNFSDYFQALGKRRFFEFPDLVREGSLACAGAVFHARSKKSGFDDVNFARSAVGLRKLRSAKVTETDAGAFLTLGLTLTTFDLITSGTSAHTITRFTLSLVRPLYPIICMDPRLDSEVLCLVFMDTVESLLRRHVPVIRYRVRDTYLVDRLVGLCAPLLPIMYDVCQFAYKFSHANPLPEQESKENSFNHLNELIESWQPQLPPDILSKFSSREVACLLSHARVFRAAVSLVLHRLQHPFGVEDQKAVYLSAEIFSECAAYSNTVGEAERLPQTLFPWMVAAFEVTSPLERATLIQKELPKSREILSLPTAKMKDCVCSVWNMRDTGRASSLFGALEQAVTYIIPL